ncbi:MAG: insulinase family protein [Rhodospirillales bacterium]|nr:insulinase family protein [Rhodospirillales bacterium]
MTPIFRSLLVAFVLGAGILSAAPAKAISIERVVTPGGIEAWLVRDHTNPIISMRFTFRGGAGLDPAERTGLANMAAALLDEGAGDLGSTAFQKKLEDLVITLRFSAGRDSFSGRLVTLVENRDTAFNLLSLALNKPRFDVEPVERIRSQILAGIRQDTEEPGAIAGKTLFKTLFPSHPYGRSTEGLIDHVGAITRADLKAFTNKRLAKDNLTIGVVGDIRPEALAALLDSTFGGLPDKAGPWALPDVKPQGAGRTIVVKKSVPQSSIVFAEQGLKRNHPDFYAAYVMNYVFGGGGFTSRLYSTIREQRGLVYSVYTGLHPLDRAGLIFGAAGTANANVGETLSLLRREWKRMADDGLTEKELADAKTYLTGSYPLRFTSSGSVAAMLVGIQRENLGIDYMDRRNSLIEAVTLADVNRAAKTLLSADNLTVVVVGMPKGVENTP